MFGFGKTKAHREIDAQTLKAMLADGSALLVDVREPDEFAAEHIKGAVNAPLSTSHCVMFRMQRARRSCSNALAASARALHSTAAPVRSRASTRISLAASAPGRPPACRSNAARAVQQGSRRQ
jgi:Rhodanese-like domain